MIDINKVIEKSFKSAGKCNQMAFYENDIGLQTLLFRASVIPKDAVTYYDATFTLYEVEPDEEEIIWFDDNFMDILLHFYEISDREAVRYAKAKIPKRYSAYIVECFESSKYIYLGCRKKLRHMPLKERGSILDVDHIGVRTIRSAQATLMLAEAALGKGDHLSAGKAYLAAGQAYEAGNIAIATDYEDAMKSNNTYADIEGMKEIIEIYKLGAEAAEKYITTGVKTEEGLDAVEMSIDAYALAASSMEYASTNSSAFKLLNYI